MWSLYEAKRMSKEETFFNALRDVFVGAKVEGESGFVNLMRIKSRYYERGVFPRLKEDIDRALAPFPEFREELFDRLYNFFKRYFSESGSIYFRFTPPHEHVYEKVYTDDRDVVLFWKTHMLYYVKTDRLFRSMAVEVDGFRFFFDVSALEHKRANEKRTLVYAFKERQEDGTLVFSVAYSEKGKQTDLAGIRRAIKEALGLSRYTSQVPTEETLERAFRLFERQSEVDYFINKDARRFLREQFNLWLYQYVFEPEERQGTVWTERRIRQLQVLKEIAYKIIDFIAQFEDELLRVWNKPKFILGSHYVITLDRIMAVGAQRAVPLLERLFAHPGMAAQVQEWRDLGMVGEDFTPEQVWVTDLTGKRLHERYQYLPLDTKHFPDLEMAILALFDHLDQELDGWLVHSENYQALNTMLPKFRGRVKCIHIDPPYNTETSGFLYTNRYQHACWLAMIENRIEIAKNFLDPQFGSLLIHIDENEMERLSLMLDQLGMPNAGTIVWDKRNPMLGKKGIATQHEYVLWRSFSEAPIYQRNKNIQLILKTAQEIVKKHGGVTPEAKREFSQWVSTYPGLSGGERAYRFLDEQGRVYRGASLEAPEPRTDPKFFQPLIHPKTGKPCPVPRNGWSRTPETLAELLERGEIIFGEDETILPQRKLFLTDSSKKQLSSVLIDPKRGKHDADALGIEFPYSHPVSLYEELIGAATDNDGDIVLDFFAGSGTTAHAVINLNREDGGRRKYILVEMADYFHTVLLPRIKKVVFSDKWRDGKAQPEGKGISHFVKYFRLEQYEEVLRKAHYRDDDAPLFFQDPYTQYVFLRDPKMLDNAETGEPVMEVDLERNEIRVDLRKLYPDIDLAETLSCLTGKWIRRIHPAADDPTRPGTVEFEDGTTVDLQNPPWELVKPLIWW
jgi:adenine-specific DNA-methyltransferase